LAAGSAFTHRIQNDQEIPMSKRSNGRVNTITAPAPIPATVSKIVPKGLDIDFDFYRKKTASENIDIFKVNVVITSAAEWMERESASSSVWSTALLGDGLVAAAQLLPRDFRDHGTTDTDPDTFKGLRHFREQLCRWIEEQGWLSYATVDFGANGAFVMTVTSEGATGDDDTPIEIRVRRNPSC
jgi:hypothetical protein